MMNLLRVARRRSEPTLTEVASANSPAELPPGEGYERYLAARGEWNDRHGDYIAQAKSWRLAFFLAIGVSLISAVGNVYQGSENHLVPYIVEVNKLGDALAAKRADVASTPDTRLITAALARWVSDTRTVYLDAGAEQHIITEAYSMVDGHSAAYDELNEYFRTNDPFAAAQNQTVDVQITSVLPISTHTWQVEWTEDERKRDGSLISETHMRGDISETVEPPTNENTIFVNPIGLYVQNFSWSSVQ